MPNMAAEPRHTVSQGLSPAQQGLLSHSPAPALKSMGLCEPEYEENNKDGTPSSIPSANKFPAHTFLKQSY